MLNRRKLFSFLATAPVATVIGAKAAMDANGNDVAPLVGDFWPDPASQYIVAGDWQFQLFKQELRQQRLFDSRFQILRS